MQQGTQQGTQQGMQQGYGQFYPQPMMYPPQMQMYGGMMPMGGAAAGPGGRLPRDGSNKVCSFFNTEKGCAKGKMCNFLHEPIRKKPRQCTFYTATGGCKKGKTCDFLHGEDDSLEPQEQDLKYQQGDSVQSLAQHNPRLVQETTEDGQPKPGSICAYFNSKFGCKKGEGCDFKHEKTAEPMRPPPQAPVDKICDFWQTPQGCRKGALCNFQHPGFGGQQNQREHRDAKVCAYFTSPRGCIKGAVCDFLHVQPTSMFNAQTGMDSTGMMMMQGGTQMTQADQMNQLQMGQMGQMTNEQQQAYYAAYQAQSGAFDQTQYGYYPQATGQDATASAYSGASAYPASAYPASTDPSQQQQAMYYTQGQDGQMYSYTTGTATGTGALLTQ